jgi:hypothetical protein
LRVDSCNNVLLARQQPAGKNVSTEAKNIVETRQRLVKIKQAEKT